MKRMVIAIMMILTLSAMRVTAASAEEGSWIDLAPFPKGQVNLLYDFAVSQPGVAGTLSLVESDKLCMDLRAGYMATSEENDIGILEIGVNIEQVPWISNAIKGIVSSAGLFGGRDFTAGVWRYGVYAVLFKIGSE